MKKAYYRGALFLLGLSIFALDFFTKKWVVLNVPSFPYEGISIFKGFFGVDFSIVHATNRGIAWSFLSSVPNLVLIARLALVLGLGIYLAVARLPKKIQIPLVIVLAGASGNINDYFQYGHVIDMFNFTFGGHCYGVFNVADASLCLSLLFLLFTKSLKTDKIAACHKHSGL